MHCDMRLRLHSYQLLALVHVSLYCTDMWLRVNECKRLQARTNAARYCVYAAAYTGLNAAPKYVPVGRASAARDGLRQCNEGNQDL